MQQRRIQVFEDWEAGRYEAIEELTDRYGFSRQWFYRWKDRWENTI
jgi:Mor family transcriptional regulator